MTTIAAIRDWLLLGHIAGAMVWFGGVLLLLALGVRAVLAERPEPAAELVGALRGIGPTVLAPAPVLMIACGVWLAVDEDAFSQLWVQLGLGLFAAAFVVGAAHQSRAAIAAERAVRRGDHAEAALALTRWAWGMGLITALLALATWDMVFRPGG